MTTERAQEFQMRITEEALALMIIHGESVSDAPSEEDISLAHYEEAVTLIGKAWGLPAEATAENLGLIQREKDVLRRIAAGENVNHMPASRSWSGPSWNTTTHRSSRMRRPRSRRTRHPLAAWHRRGTDGPTAGRSETQIYVPAWRENSRGIF